MDTLLNARRPMPGSRVLFAEDFDLSRRRDAMPVPEIVNASYTAAELVEARAAAWALGHAAGTDEAKATTVATTRSLLDGIAAALRDARAEATAVAERSVEPIARLLLDSLAKLFPALCEHHGETEVRALIRAILPALAQEPAITVRVNPAHTPALMRELDRLDAELVERVRLVAVEAIAVGDVRVSWHDGSAVRDTAALWQQVRAVLEPAGQLSAEPPSVPDNEPAPDHRSVVDRISASGWTSSAVQVSAAETAGAPERVRSAERVGAPEKVGAAERIAVPERVGATKTAPVIIMETEHVD
jgi:flagellar biosynthesis/type III secretory pathway protein FliH